MSVRLTTLPNGLRVVSDRMREVETVSVGVWIAAGSRCESPRLNGAAHFLEHMLFKGTARRSALDIAADIEAVGGQMNAYTGRDVTAFYVRLLKEDLALGLDVLADMLLAPALDTAELERERGVVLQEIAQAHDTPDDIVFDDWQETAFPDQAVGRPVLGRPDTVARLSRADIAGYRAAHYGADRMVLSASGKLEHDALVDLAARLFAEARPAGPTPLETPRYVGGERHLARDLEQLHLVLGFPGPGLVDEAGGAAMGILATALGGGMSSRLFQEIREKRGLVYAVHAFTQAQADCGLFGVYAGTGPGEAAELVPVLCDELVRATEGLSAEEFDRAKAQLKASLLMGLESCPARCEQLGQHMLVYGRPRGPGEIVELIDAVTPDAVTAQARAMLAAPPTLAAIGPGGALKPLERISDRLAA